MTNYGTATEAKINEVIDACTRYGSRSIIALAGVPGTGKSFVASVAAQRLAGDPLLVRELQFHPSFSYEEFIEGMRIDAAGAVVVKPGVFLEWNQQALDDPDNTYVLLIEELTRANLPAVLGELLTYLEYRDRTFYTVYSRRPVQVATNLTLVATYNPTDQSAIEVDAALLRRLRILRCPPSNEQLAEMLDGKLPKPVIDKLASMFDAAARAAKAAGTVYEDVMPFGHGVFAEVGSESPDLFLLWRERIEHILRQPLKEPHQLTPVIEKEYPWRHSAYSVAAAASSAGSASTTAPAGPGGGGGGAAAATGSVSAEGASASSEPAALEAAVTEEEQALAVESPPSDAGAGELGTAVDDNEVLTDQDDPGGGTAVAVDGEQD
jgi:5-methylcytosine-specific restriction enzyme B